MERNWFEELGFRLFLFSLFLTIVMFGFGFTKQQVIIGHEQAHYQNFQYHGINSYINYTYEGPFYNSGVTHPLSSNGYCDEDCDLGNIINEDIGYTILGLLEGIKAIFILFGVFFIIVYPLVKEYE